MDNKVTEQQTQQNCVPTGPPIEVAPHCVPTGSPIEVVPHCVPTGPPIEVVPNCIPPPQYGTYPPIPSLQQMQLLKESVKSQIKSASLRRAGLAGSDPWGTEVAPETLTPGIPLAESLTQNPEALATGLTPGAGLPGLTILGQPHSLLNLQGKNGSNDAPQLINSRVTYFAPTYSTTEHREFINCCEDCCEDICENCCLNCCLDCSKITQLFGTSNGRLIKNDNKGDYILLENALPLNPLAGYPPTQVSIQSVNPLTGAPIDVYPIHPTAVCPTNPCNNGINANTIGNIKL